MIILSEFIVNLKPTIETKKILHGSLIAIIPVAILGILIPLSNSGFMVNQNEIGILNHIKNTKQLGDLYLIPVNVPDLASTTKGSLSSDFKPVGKKR